jgi:hypothetical protein
VETVTTFDESQPESAVIAYRVADDNKGTFSSYTADFIGPRIVAKLF